MLCAPSVRPPPGHNSARASTVNIAVLCVPLWNGMGAFNLYEFAHRFPQIAVLADAGQILAQTDGFHIEAHEACDWARLLRNKKASHMVGWLVGWLQNGSLVVRQASIERVCLSVCLSVCLPGCQAGCRFRAEFSRSDCVCFAPVLNLNLPCSWPLYPDQRRQPPRPAG